MAVSVEKVVLAEAGDAGGARERAGRPATWCAGLLAVAGALSWTQPWVAGSDLWWHLASGRKMVETGQLPRVDSFSHTAAGDAWTNHEWLWDLIYWTAYDLDPQLCAWLNLAVIGLVFGLVFALAVRVSQSLLASGLALWMAAATSHWFFDIRPHLFTLLFLQIFLLTCKRAYGPWLWPPLVVLWANLHAGIAFGVGAIGLFVLVMITRDSLAVRGLRLPRRELALLAAALLSVLVNPYGVQLLDYPLAYLNEASPFRTIVEWKSPELYFDLASFQGRFWALAAIFFGSALVMFRRLPYEVALTCVALVMAMVSRRFIPLFAILAVPVVAAALAIRVQEIREHWEPPGRRLLLAATWVSTALLVLLLWQNVRLLPDLLHRWTANSYSPEAAVRFLRAIDPPKRLFNHYPWGGYLTLHAPEIPVFIDGRANTIYGDELYLDYSAIVRVESGYRELLARYEVDMAMVPTSSPLANDLATRIPSWETIYSDVRTTLLVPPEIEAWRDLPPDLVQVVGEHPDLLISLARGRARAGDLAGATKRMRNVIERWPLHTTAYTQLVEQLAATRDAEQISEVIERGIQAAPREVVQLRRAEGLALRLAGDLERAIWSLERASADGPFQSAANTRITLQQLRAQLRSMTTAGDSGS